MSSGRTAVGYGVVFFIISISFSSSDGKTLRTTNTDKAFDRWNRSAIYYYLDPAFTATEANMVNQAISRVMSSLSYCVLFTPVAASAPVYKIKFTPLTGGPGSAPQTACFSYPGVSLVTRQTSLEQVVSLARGPTGCLDSYCSIQKYIALLLGKRNEHQRGDRDSWITVQTDDNLGTPGAYRRYTTGPGGEAYWGLFAYDYCSITHNQPTDFAKSGVPAFTVPSGKPPGFIPKLCQLSTTDCKLISMMYQCNSALCANIDCASQTQGASTAAATTPVTTATTTAISTATTVVTTVASATTTVTPCDFCTSIDETARLLNGKTMVFSGKCALEINPITTAKIGSPVQISSLFPDAAITGPLQAVWQSDANTIHVLTQANYQYSCTATICTTETPMAGPPSSVHDYTSNLAAPTYKIYTVDTAGESYKEGASASQNSDVWYLSTPTTVVLFPEPWLAAYRTGVADTSGISSSPAMEVMNVITKFGTMLRYQPAVYKPNGFNDFTAINVPNNVMWCP